MAGDAGTASDGSAGMICGAGTDGGTGLAAALRAATAGFLGAGIAMPGIDWSMGAAKAGVADDPASNAIETAVDGRRTGKLMPQPLAMIPQRGIRKR